MEYKFVVFILAILKSDICTLARNNDIRTNQKIRFGFNQGTVPNERGLFEDSDEVGTINEEKSSSLQLDCKDPKNLDFILIPIPAEAKKIIQENSVQSNGIPIKSPTRVLYGKDVDKRNNDKIYDRRINDARRLLQISSAYPVLNDMDLDKRDKTNLANFRKHLWVLAAPSRPSHINKRLRVNNALTRNEERLEDAHLNDFEEHNGDADFRRSLGLNAAPPRPRNLGDDTRRSFGLSSFLPIPLDRHGNRVYRHFGNEYPAGDFRRSLIPVK